MSIDAALEFTDKTCRNDSLAGILAAEVRRLREENERLRENARIIYELEQLAARSNNDLLVENERLNALLQSTECEK